MEENPEILSIPEVAKRLRCSKAHVYNAINGKVAGISKLPAICIGRRKVVRRCSLEAWVRVNDQAAILATSPEMRPVGA